MIHHTNGRALDPEPFVDKGREQPPQHRRSSRDGSPQGISADLDVLKHVQAITRFETSIGNGKEGHLLPRTLHLRSQGAPLEHLPVPQRIPTTLRR